MEMMDQLYAQYGYVAGLGALVELRLRLLASKTPELARFAHDKELDALEEKVFAHFDSSFAEGEKEFLKGARGLRNKVLHSDFKSASSKARDINGGEPQGPSAYMLRLSTGEVKPIGETTKRDGGVFGWLLECAQTGVFKEAEGIFRKAADIYGRVSFDAATDGMSPEDIERIKRAGIKQSPNQNGD